MNVPPSKKATLYIETASQAIFEQSTAFLTRLAWADQIVMGSPEDLKGCVQVITDSAKVYMPLSQLVDRDKEIARLTKEKQAARRHLLPGRQAQQSGLCLQGAGEGGQRPESQTRKGQGAAEQDRVEPRSFQQLNVPFVEKESAGTRLRSGVLCWLETDVKGIFLSVIIEVARKPELAAAGRDRPGEPQVDGKLVASKETGCRLCHKFVCCAQ